MHVLKRIAAASVAAFALPAVAEIVVFEHDGFDGRAVGARGPVANLDHHGFNDQASSAIVHRGVYEVCEHAHFGGHCVLLGPGRYPSFNRMGFNDQASSIRPVDPERVAERSYAAPPSAYDYPPRRW